jgi:hypothetical protein
MRGADSHCESLFTTVKLEDFVAANHPLCPIRAWVNDALAKMDAHLERQRAPIHAGLARDADRLREKRSSCDKRGRARDIPKLCERFFIPTLVNKYEGPRSGAALRRHFNQQPRMKSST